MYEIDYFYKGKGFFMKKIALTGATGKLGSLVVQFLLEKGVPAKDIIVIIRNEKKAADFKRLGLEVRIGDYDNLDSLHQAFRDLEQVLFISSPSADDTHRIHQHAHVVKALRDAQVEHIIYTSLAFAERMSIGLEHVHLATEHLIKTTGIPHTFLRNAFYMDMLVNPGLQEVVEVGELISSTNDGKINFVIRSDLAQAAATVLMDGKEHENRSYELVNPAPFTFTDLAAALSRKFDKKVQHRDLSPEEAFAYFVKTGTPPEAADFIVHRLHKAISYGEFSYASDDLERLIKRKPMTFLDVVIEL